MTGPNRTRRAFTLIETVICAAIIAGLGVALLTSIGHATRGALVARERDTASSIASAMLADLFSTPHADDSASPLVPDTVTVLGVTVLGVVRPVPPREDLARLNDYNGRLESPPQDRAGNGLADLSDWAVRVDIQHVSPATLGPAVSYTGLARVTINVAKGDRIMATRLIYRSSAWDTFTPAAESMP